MAAGWDAYVTALEKSGVDMAAVLTHDGTVCAKSAGCPSMENINAKVGS